MILPSTEGATLMTPSLKAFMDDITVLTKTVHSAKAVLERLGNLIKRSQMKFKATKSKSCTIANGKQKEVEFMIAGENVPTAKKEPEKKVLVPGTRMVSLTDIKEYRFTTGSKV